MYSTKQMHEIAQAIAIEKGPRLIRSNSEKLAIYGLTKKELLQIFIDNNFSPRRSSWINIIKDWGTDYFYGDLIASNFFLENAWGAYVIFVNLSKDELITLRMFAENNDARAIGKAEDYDEGTYDLSKIVDITNEAKTTKQEFFSGVEQV